MPEALENILTNRGVEAASILLFVGVAWFTWSLLSMVNRVRSEHAETWEFESARRIKLRSESQMFRWFEPLIDDRAAVIRSRTGSEAMLARLGRHLPAAGQSRAWLPEEFIAAKQIEGVLVAILAAVFGWLLGGVEVAVLAGLCGGWGYPQLVIRDVNGKAERRMLQLKQRLPFAIDLMAFMMGAGASFFESVQTVVNENRGHPLGAELSEVVRQIALGRSRHTALEQLHERLLDEDVKEFVFAINSGEEMGTPLSSILRSQADQMRLKRSQWAEKAAAEAQVTIVFPGMLIMLACLVIVAAPFVLAYMEQS